MSDSFRKLEIDIDLYNPYIEKLKVNQFENVTIVANVTEKGEKKGYTPNKLTLNYSNPNGETVPLEDGTVTCNLNEFTINLPRSCTAISGSALCQLSVSKDGKFLFSFPIQILIIPSAIGNLLYKDDDIITKLKTLISDATTVSKEFEKEKVNIENYVEQIKMTSQNAKNEMESYCEDVTRRIETVGNYNINRVNDSGTSALNMINKETATSLSAIKAAGNVDAAIVSQNSADIVTIKDQLTNQNWFWGDDNLMQDIINLNQLNQDWDYFKQRFDFNIGIEGEYLIQSAFDVYYPVGSIYISTKNESPATKYQLRSTKWEVFGQGRVLIGAGTGKDKNNTSLTFNAGYTGGEYNHVLLKEEMPIHDHDQYVGASSGEWGVRADYNSDSRCANFPQGKTGSNGGNQGHNNIQPYIVVYMWKRTE